MLKNIEWIFFDVGTTLVDESAAYNHRVRDMIKDTDISFEEFIDKRILFAKQNCSDGMEAIKYFGLTKTPWHKEDEVPYDDAVNVLKQLNERGYKIGIIANQSAGTEQRLKNWGMMEYINFVVSSAEEGVSKPDKEIFIIALRRAGCNPENAVMIGDRIDNDIYPAKKLGMKTVWIKQGFARFQNPVNSEYIADYTINTLSELADII